ncbi:MAG: hypothetical protein ACKPKO_03145, partial [Candidatus Fonsibacter sp.]
MHVLVYELVVPTTADDLDFVKKSKNYVPLYSVYTTNDKQSVGQQIEGCFAKIPTKGGLEKLAAAVGID